MKFLGTILCLTGASVDCLAIHTDHPRIIGLSGHAIFLAGLLVVFRKVIAKRARDKMDARLDRIDASCTKILGSEKLDPVINGKMLHAISVDPWRAATGCLSPESAKIQMETSECMIAALRSLCRDRYAEIVRLKAQVAELEHHIRGM